MKSFLRNFRLEKFHFFLLGIVLINWVTGIIIGYRLNQNVTITLKIILYVTGIILLLKTIRPFNKMTIYFSFYAISSLMIGLFILFGGIFLSILSSLALYPIYPKQTEYKTETFRIYDRFQGFMAQCCSYEIVETKQYIIEKHLGYIKIDKPINKDKDQFILNNNNIIYKHDIESYVNNKKTIRDTAEILYFE